MWWRGGLCDRGRWSRGRWRIDFDGCLCLFLNRGFVHYARVESRRQSARSMGGTRVQSDLRMRVFVRIAHDVLSMLLVFQGPLTWRLYVRPSVERGPGNYMISGETLALKTKDLLSMRTFV